MRHVRDAIDATTRGWFVMSAGSLTRLAIGLIASVIIARTFGPSNLGIYATVAAIAATTGAICEFGLTESAVRRIASSWPDAPARARETAKSYFWLRLGAAIVVVGVAILMLPLASVIGVELPRLRFVVLGLLGVIATGLCGATNGILQAIRRFGLLSLVLVSNSVLTVVGAIVLRLAGILTIGSALIVLGIGTSLMSFVLGWKFLPHDFSFGFPGRSVLRREGRLLFGFGVWLWIANSLAMAAAQVDLLLAAHWLTPAAVGTYALAISLSSKANVLSQSLHAVLLPVASSLRSRAGVRTYLRRGAMRSAAGVLLVLTAMPLARPLIPFVFGESYADSVSLVLALLGVAIVDLIVAPVVLLAFTAERPKLIAAADAAKLLALIGTAVGAVPALGAYGLVVAKLAASLAGCAVVVGALVWSGWFASPEAHFAEAISDR